MASDLAAYGRGATIASLLKKGSYKALFSAPEAGTAVLDWYYLPPGAKLAKNSKHAPVLVASGKLTFRSASSVALTIRLTAKGRALLHAAKQMRLTAKCVFTPTSGEVITASAGFALKRAAATSRSAHK